MSKTLTVNWQGERAFVAANAAENRVAIDGNHSGRGMGASELLLAALGGCIATTAIGVLEKKRQKINSFEIEVQGEQLPDWPRSFTQFHLICRVSGDEVDPQAVERAIELAETRYCTVSSSLRGPVTHEIIITPS
ncbi:MAG: OsmC family protein [Caldilineales bacterium]|nr:OsmC family protein [Caldilineales bacterium]